MSITVAIVGSGDMGSAIARCLAGEKVAVTTCLAGRSERSRNLADAAGMRDVASLEALAGGADMLLSIVPPSRAPDFAQSACAAITRAGRDVLLVDCNAVSPATLSHIAATAAAHGIRFQDAGIVGQPPRPGRAAVRIYTSGPFNEEMAALAGEHIDIRPLTGDPGRASAIKMAYASLTKGTNALRVAALLAGERLGVGAALRAELEQNLPEVYAAIERRVPDLAADAARWTGEMREIAATYESAGLPPSFHKGAEAIYALLAETPLAAESRDEARQSGRSLEETLEIFLRALAAR